MPTYVLTCNQCGRTFERQGRVSDPIRTMPCENGDCPGTAYRNYEVEHGGFRNTPGNWPMTSQALAVHPKQIADAVRTAERLGVPTDFTPTGEPIFRSRGHRREYMRALGVRDLDAGYGDWAGEKYAREPEPIELVDNDT